MALLSEIIVSLFHIIRLKLFYIFGVTELSSADEKKQNTTKVLEDQPIVLH